MALDLARAREEGLAAQRAAAIELTKLTEARTEADKEQKVAAALRLGLEAYADGRIVAALPNQRLNLRIGDAAEEKSFGEKISPAWGQIHAVVQSVRLAERSSELEKAQKDAIDEHALAITARAGSAARSAELEAREREVAQRSDQMAEYQELLNEKFSINLSIETGIYAINRG